jgi:hypothetical protein
MDFTRREILGFFLGAPLALAACGRRPPELPDGEIVGASVNVGHLIREFRGAEVAPADWETCEVSIVGGGAAGLSAAWKFEREGFTDYRIFELEPALGGTSRSGRTGDFGYPWGAHYLPVPFGENTELVALLAEMSLTEGRNQDGDPVVKEQFLCREPEERVFYKGRWYEGLYLHAGESEDDRRQLAAFQAEIDRWVAWRDGRGRRAFVLPVAACSDDPEVVALDRVSFSEWLTGKGFTSERLLWYCDYATRDDYGLKSDQASAWAGLFYFCSRVRRMGLESQAFITFPEGNGRFIEHLAEASAGRISSGTLVMDIRPREGGADVVYLDTSVNRLRGVRSKKVIFAAPMFTAKHVISDFREGRAGSVSSFEHNAWFVANLFLKDRPKPRSAKDFPLAWDNVLYESASLGYVNASHQKGIDHGPTVLTYYYPMCAEENGRDRLLELGWGDFADIVMTDISRAHPDIASLITRLDVMRWGHAMISPKPGFIWGSERRRAASPHRGIHFAHSDLSGVALFEEAFHHGVRSAREILAARGGG